MAGYSVRKQAKQDAPVAISGGDIGAGSPFDRLPRIWYPPCPGMQRGRHRRRALGVLFLALLLLVPLAARAHTHSSGGASATCAICIAAHHTPSIVGSDPAPVSIVAETSAGLGAPTGVVVPQHRSPQASRAPPEFAPVEQD